MCNLEPRFKAWGSFSAEPVTFGRPMRPPESLVSATQRIAKLGTLGNYKY